MAHEQESIFFRKTAKVAAGVTLALSLAIGIESRKSECVGKIDWKGDIAVCKTEDKRIIVQGPYTKPFTLPEGVCRTSQVLVSYPDSIFYFRYLDKGYNLETNHLDLKTGEYGNPTYYRIPVYVPYYSPNIFC